MIVSGIIYEAIGNLRYQVLNQKWTIISEATAVHARVGAGSFELFASSPLRAYE